MDLNTKHQDDEDWDEDEGPDGDDDFDYDEFVENEFGGDKQRTRHSTLIRVTAIILLFVSIVLTFTLLGF